MRTTIIKGMRKSIFKPLVSFWYFFWYVERGLVCFPWTRVCVCRNDQVEAVKILPRFSLVALIRFLNKLLSLLLLRTLGMNEILLVDFVNQSFEIFWNLLDIFPADRIILYTRTWMLHLRGPICMIFSNDQSRAILFCKINSCFPIWINQDFCQ